jgi:CubicO group peptidase (beta-lactamase class C family)
MTRIKRLRVFAFFVILASFILITFSCVREKAEKEEPSAHALKTEVPKEALIAELEQQIPRLMEKAMIPGLSIAVIREGEILWAKGFGVKNVETKEPVDESTVFQAASLSKPVFAYAVLQMVERGELKLDKPLIEYVPESYIEKEFLKGKIEDERLRKITARHVLTHSPGFPNWRPRGKPLTIQFEPGEKFSYSGEGFVYLQKVVEKMTGLPLNEFMIKHVFEPLKMESSSYGWQDRYDALFADHHNALMGTGERWKFEWANAASSLHTTASDYARFMNALLNHQGLKAENMQNFLNPHIKTSWDNADGLFWGLGIGLQQSDNGWAFWHWGDNGEYRCFALALEKQKMGVVYFTNSYNGLTISKDIVQLAVGGEHPVFAASVMTEYGTYNSKEMQFVKIYKNEGLNPALDYYHELKEKSPEEKIFGEDLVNGFGYILLGAKKMDDAIAIFKMNVEAYPDSANVYDSLAEAYMEKGEKDLAIKYYQKSLKLNPENTNAIEKLKELQGK